MCEAEMSDTDRVPYEENSDNGVILCGVYIPEELIADILCLYVDCESLANCQVVCVKWRKLLDEYVWKKKAELINGQLIQSEIKIPWDVYYALCKKKPIGRNLLKNHSGSDGFKHWTIMKQGGQRWICESPPRGVPQLPNDPVFEGKNCCFVTSFSLCSKKQSIDLVKEGLSPFLLDKLQPSILVGEWYSARWDCAAFYECTVKLIDKNNKLLDLYQFRDHVVDVKQDMWHHFEHEFEGFGPGVRKVVFEHSGVDRRFWAGHYGSKMCGASVVVSFVSNLNEDTSVTKEKLSGDDTVCDQNYNQVLRLN